MQQSSKQSWGHFGSFSEAHIQLQLTVNKAADTLLSPSQLPMCILHRLWSIPWENTQLQYSVTAHNQKKTPPILSDTVPFLRTPKGHAQKQCFSVFLHHITPFRNLGELNIPFAPRSVTTFNPNVSSANSKKTHRQTWNISRSCSCHIPCQNTTVFLI